MEVTVTKYITLPNRYAGYNDDGNFIQPHVISMMIFDELKLQNIKEFVNEANITIIEDEIKDFLGKKMDEEQPGLKQRLEEEMKTSSIITFTSNEEENKRKIDASTKKMMDMATASRYYFEPYSLQYFRTYTSILKEKCQTLLSVLDDINKCKSQKLSEEAEQRLLELDFHINSDGNIYFKDAERLAAAIIYNVSDLREKIQVGNNLETYLTFKESRHRLMKDDIWESEIYPIREIQKKDRYCAYMPQFIALSEDQQTQVQKEELENFSRWMKSDFEEDDEKISCKNPKLVKLKKNIEE